MSSWCLIFGFWLELVGNNFETKKMNKKCVTISWPKMGSGQMKTPWNGHEKSYSVSFKVLFRLERYFEAKWRRMKPFGPKKSPPHPPFSGAGTPSQPKRGLQGGGQKGPTGPTWGPHISVWEAVWPISPGGIVWSILPGLSNKTDIRCQLCTNMEIWDPQKYPIFVQGVLIHLTLTRVNLWTIV